MSAGMAEVIAAHAYSHAEIEDHPEHGYSDVAVCVCGTRLLQPLGEPNDRDDLHADHVAEELAKAGYGNVQEAPRIVHYAGNVRQVGHTGAPDGWSAEAWHESAYGDTGEGYSLPGRLYVIQCAWCEAVFLANTKAEALVLYRKHEDEMQTPDPLAAALADPEGHALVKAIHDRKAEA